jgi:hypothetical protein
MNPLASLFDALDDALLDRFGESDARYDVLYRLDQCRRAVVEMARPVQVPLAAKGTAGVNRCPGLPPGGSGHLAVPGPVRDRG